MSNTKTLSVTVLMSKKEADKTCQQINLEFTQAKVHGRKAGEAAYRCGILLISYRDMEGWRAQGYESFTEGAMKEFAEFATTKQAVSRMTRHAEVITLLGEVPSTEVTKAIQALPEPEAKEIYDEAKEAAGTGTPTGSQVRAAAQKHRETPAQSAAADSTKPAAGKPDPKPAPAEKKAPPKLAAALDRIAAVCGKGVATSIKNGTLNNVNQKGAIFWASLKDADMVLTQELIVTKRWKPKTAFQFMSKAPNDTTKIGALHNLTIAQGGVSTVVIGAFATVTLNIRKLPDEWAKIKKLLDVDK